MGLPFACPVMRHPCSPSLVMITLKRCERWKAYGRHSIAISGRPRHTSVRHYDHQVTAISAICVTCGLPSSCCLVTLSIVHLLSTSGKISFAVFDMATSSCSLGDVDLKHPANKVAVSSKTFRDFGIDVGSKCTKIDVNHMKNKKRIHRLMI